MIFEFHKFFPSPPPCPWASAPSGNTLLEPEVRLHVVGGAGSGDRRSKRLERRPQRPGQTAVPVWETMGRDQSQSSKPGTSRPHGPQSGDRRLGPRLQGPLGAGPGPITEEQITSTPWGVRTLVVSAQPAPRVPLPSRQRGGDQPSQGPQEPRKPC